MKVEGILGDKVESVFMNGGLAFTARRPSQEKAKASSVIFNLDTLVEL